MPILYFEQSLFHDIILRDGKVNAAEQTVKEGLRIRVVKDKNTSYAYTESSLASDRKSGKKRQPSLQTGCLRQLPALQSTH